MTYILIHHKGQTVLWRRDGNYYRSRIVDTRLSPSYKTEYMVTYGLFDTDWVTRYDLRPDNLTHVPQNIRNVTDYVTFDPPD